jgi:hypothetical protein
VAGISLIANRNSVVLYRTFSFRDRNRRPRNNRKTIGKVVRGTCNVVFNDYFMALIRTQGLSLDDLRGKDLGQIARSVDFTREVGRDSYQDKRFDPANTIEVADERLRRFGWGRPGDGPEPGEDDLSAMGTFAAAGAAPAARPAPPGRLPLPHPFLPPRNVQFGRPAGPTLVPPPERGPKRPLDPGSSQAAEGSPSRPPAGDRPPLSFPDEADEQPNPAVEFLKARNFGHVIDYAFLERTFAVKSYGTQLLLEHISGDLGLTALLRQVFPDIWAELLTLSFYLISENNHLRYCSDWLANVEGLLPSDRLSFGRIEEVLAGVTESRRGEFFSRWAVHLGDPGHVAFNVDSIASGKPSTDNIFLDYGNPECRPSRINLAVILGAQSRLPVYAAAYLGPPSEVGPFHGAIRQAGCLGPDPAFRYAFGKTFYNTPNLAEIVDNLGLSNYLIQLPMDHELSTYLIKQCSSNFYLVNYNFNNNKILFSFAVDVKWENKTGLKVYIFLDERSHLIAKKEVYRELFMFKQDVASLPAKYDRPRIYGDFFQMDHGGLSSSVQVLHNNILNKYKNSGWFLVLSDQRIELSEILDTYVIKEYIDKYFLSMKNNLNIFDLNTNTNSYNDKKIFVSFIALILYSHMHNTIHKHNINTETTVQKMIKDFNNIKIAYDGPAAYYAPLNPLQRRIFRAFGVGGR